jgi:hypothetical protein
MSNTFWVAVCVAMVVMCKIRMQFQVLVQFDFYKEKKKKENEKEQSVNTRAAEVLMTMQRVDPQAVASRQAIPPWLEDGCPPKAQVWNH